MQWIRLLLLLSPSDNFKTAMENRFTKKTIAVIATGAVVLAGAGVGIVLWTNDNADNNPPGTTPSPTSIQYEEPPQGGIDPTIVLTEEQLALLPETTQYIEGPARNLGEVITYNYPGAEGSSYDWSFPNELVPAATWTAEEYINGALFNPYFITDWWGAKDNYKESGPASHIYPYLSKELQAEFSEKASAYATGNDEAETWLAGRMFLPGELEIRPGCYENWDAGTCWPDGVQAGTITAASGIFTSQTSVDLNIIVVTDVLYQHPGYTDGSLASQNRTYELKMTVEFSEGPTADRLDDTENPYMKITALEGSVVTGEPEDHLILGSLPPAP